MILLDPQYQVDLRYGHKSTNRTSLAKTSYWIGILISDMATINICTLIHIIDYMLILKKVVDMLAAIGTLINAEEY